MGKSNQNNSNFSSETMEVSRSSSSAEKKRTAYPEFYAQQKYPPVIKEKSRHSPVRENLEFVWGKPTLKEWLREVL